MLTSLLLENFNYSYRESSSPRKLLYSLYYTDYSFLSLNVRMPRDSSKLENSSAHSVFCQLVETLIFFLLYFFFFFVPRYLLDKSQVYFLHLRHLRTCMCERRMFKLRHILYIHFNFFFLLHTLRSSS